MSSLAQPASDWCQPPAGHERIWIGLALGWCLVLSLMMPFWHFNGKQNSRGEAYSVKPDAFLARAEKFIAANKVGEEKSAPASSRSLNPRPAATPISSRAGGRGTRFSSFGSAKPTGCTSRPSTCSTGFRSSRST